MDEFLAAYEEAVRFLCPDAPDTEAPWGAGVWEAIEEECGRFLALAKELGLEERDSSQAATDFYLTRNGHGTGFRDREEVWGELSDALHALAKKFGESEGYEGDDGKLYVFPHLGD